MQRSTIFFMKMHSVVKYFHEKSSIYLNTMCERKSLVQFEALDYWHQYRYGYPRIGEYYTSRCRSPYILLCPKWNALSISKIFKWNCWVYSNVQFSLLVVYFKNVGYPSTPSCHNGLLQRAELPTCQHHAALSQYMCGTGSLTTGQCLYPTIYCPSLFELAFWGGDSNFWRNINRFWCLI